MKAMVYLNEAEGHFFGWRPEHMGHLEATGMLTFGNYTSPEDALDVVFAFCNGQDPQSDVNWYHYGWRSLSVGDVVLLMSDDYTEQRTWICERAGWTLLEGNPIRLCEVGENHVHDRGVVI
jgi:hypothetical protein